MKQKMALKNKKKTNKRGNFNIDSTDENESHCGNFIFCQKLKSSVSFIQLKPISNIFLCGLSLQLPSTQSESPLAPKCHVSFKVCTQL
jgi:hypothetical protein